MALSLPRSVVVPAGPVPAVAESSKVWVRLARVWRLTEYRSRRRISAGLLPGWLFRIGGFFGCESGNCVGHVVRPSVRDVAPCS